MKAETFTFATGQWSTVDDYPYHDNAEGLYDYDMVYIEEQSAFFVIGGRFKTTGGGYTSNNLATIGKFQNGAWSDAGQLAVAHTVLLFYFFLFRN